MYYGMGAFPAGKLAGDLSLSFTSTYCWG